MCVGTRLALVMAAGMASATYGVDPDDAGVASVMVNTPSRSAAPSAPRC